LRSRWTAPHRSETLHRRFGRWLDDGYWPWFGKSDRPSRFSHASTRAAKPATIAAMLVVVSITAGRMFRLLSFIPWLLTSTTRSMQTFPSRSVSSFGGDPVAPRVGRSPNPQGRFLTLVPGVKRLLLDGAQLLVDLGLEHGDIFER